MNVIIVIINVVRPVLWKDAYRVFPDTEEGRKNALAWAEFNGLKREGQINFEPGVMYSQFEQPNFIGIICQKVQG